MKTTKLILNLAALFGVVFTISLHAQTSAFTYQGRLTDSSGPANGTYDLQFTIYDADTGGSVIAGPITNSPVAVTNGLFTTTLDFGAGVFDGSDRWLEIGVRTNGASGWAALSPRQQITTAPYAIMAGTAGRLPGLAIQQNPNGAPNITVGAPVNFVADGVVGATIGGGGATNFSGLSYTNEITANFGTIGGGIGNISGDTATVAGGVLNAANALDSSVGGGRGNAASGQYATVGGGRANRADGEYATASGGWVNTASGFVATVGGGYNNTASGNYAGVGSGSFNFATNLNASVCGGANNVAGENASSVGGGSENQALNDHAAIAGGQWNVASGDHAFGGGGSSNTASGTNAFVGGGTGNLAGNSYATVSGGHSNTNLAGGGFIGGGKLNEMDADAFGTIGGGRQNLIQSGSPEATIAGGWTNTIGPNADQAAIGGGRQNLVVAPDATVGGGFNNQATNTAATVPGGANNVAGGRWSLAAGRYAQAANDGAFVWADSQNAAFASTNDDSFNVRARGGARFETAGAGLTIDGQPVLTSGPGNGVVIQQNSAGAPNVIEGAAYNYVPSGIIGATIGGGGGTNQEYFGGNTFSNSVTCAFGTVAGGLQNTAGGNDDATVSGGFDNTAIGEAATIGGGLENSISQTYSTIAGGDHNQIQSDHASIGGGNGNLITTSGSTATIGGGYQNVAGQRFATVPGGANNTAAGQWSFAAGRRAKAVNDGTFVWADSQNADFSSTNNDSFNVRAQGGIRLVTSGAGMTVDGPIDGAISIQHNSYGAPNVIEGAPNNLVGTGAYGATIGGGGATLFGYGSNSVTGSFGTVSGGAHNTATVFGTVSGGQANIAGYYAAVPGGFEDSAAGGYSFAAGAYAHADEEGDFVWSDDSGTETASFATNQFMARASGGVVFLTGKQASPTSYAMGGAGVALSPGGTAWTTISDRNAKKNFQPVNYEAVLDKLVKVPVEKWNYKWEKNTNTPNIGPMAQDFKHAFYPGRNDKGITTLEFDGVELAAIKGLNQKLQEESRAKEAEIEKQNTEIQSLQQTVQQLKDLVNQLAAKNRGA